MDTLGPVSVLDSGRRSRETLVADRLTRRRSPDRPRLKQAHSEVDVVYRIPQPYRTSFSAKHSVERLPGSHRSRSLSPTSSLRSVQSSRSERAGGPRRHGRAKSPKRVTYDTRVTVRHSDADDSMFTELSSRELESSRSHPPHHHNPSSYHHHLYKSPPSFHSQSSNHTSKDSGLDYSTELRDLSDQIIRMDWSKKDELDSAPALHSPQGILKESQNSHHKQSTDRGGGGRSTLPLATSNASANTAQQSHGARTPAVGRDDKENTPNGSPPAPHRPAGGGGSDFYHTPKLTSSTVSRDYQYDRTFSYRQAISDHYSSEVRALVDAGIEEKAPYIHAEDRGDGRLQPQQRSSSVSVVSRVSSQQASSKLTPAKRSVSTSISNFFRRISPHLGRKRGGTKDRSNNGSKAGSSQSLPATAGVLIMDPETPSPIPATAQHANTTPPAASAPEKARSSSGHFSRSRIRNSFLKLMGGSRKDSKAKVSAAIHSDGGQAGAAASSPQQQSVNLNSSQGSHDSQGTGSDASFDRGSGTECERRTLPESAQRKLKSMEKGGFAKKDVYREFKERCSPHSATAGAPAAADSNLEERYRAIKAQYKDRPLPLDDDFSFEQSHSHHGRGSTTIPQSRSGDMTEKELSHFLSSHDSSRISRSETDGLGCGEGEGRGGVKAEPPSSLDVVPPRAIRLLQASTISTISGDESIGECSLDWNLTSSQPSLLSGTSQSAGGGSSLSKKAVLSQSLVSSTEGPLPLPSESSVDAPVPRRRQKDALVLGQELIEASGGLSDKENASPLSPASNSGSEGLGPDPTHKPSYLKLSCAVSGYGKYSRYSSYKNISTRSPFSSTSSLRSDLSSPDATMPSSLRSPGSEGGGRLVGGGGEGAVRTPPSSSSTAACCSPASAAIAMAAALSNGQSRVACGGAPTAALNGHNAPRLYPTGDPVKDGDYFLNITSSEEERLNQQAKWAEGLMRSQDLPEEVNGRIRAAIGKSNLLISQKFQQFRELCTQHMHPEPEERTPLYEDLQGFWEMVKIQVDSVDDNFAEIDHMSQNGWKEIPKLVPSRRSSASSSPKSGSLSQTSTPSATPGHTPGSRRRGLKGGTKDTPDSSPEHAQKIRSAAKARDEARKRMLAEKRAAMKQQQQQQQQEAATPDIEIFLPESSKK